MGINKKEIAERLISLDQKFSSIKETPLEGLTDLINSVRNDLARLHMDVIQEDQEIKPQAKPDLKSDQSNYVIPQGLIVSGLSDRASKFEKYPIKNNLLLPETYPAVIEIYENNFLNIISNDNNSTSTEALREFKKILLSVILESLKTGAFVNYYELATHYPSTSKVNLTKKRTNMQSIIGQISFKLSKLSNVHIDTVRSEEKKGYFRFFLYRNPNHRPETPNEVQF